MEKVLVVTGIWAICVLGAVLFIRGAVAAGAARRDAAAQAASNETTTDAVQS